MTKEELKQRLIELMGDTQLGVNINALTDNFWEQVFADLADYLIANGVTIREWIPVNKTVRYEAEYRVQYERVWSDGSRHTYWETVTKEEYDAVLKELEGAMG